MNISVIGGDLRIVELIKFLSTNEKNQISLYGMDNNIELKSLKSFNLLEDAIQNSEIIITSIPLSKDGQLINAPFSSNKIFVKDLFELACNKRIITGNVTDEIAKNINQSNQNEIIDILKYEELTILNAIPTAEGAIQLAMEESKITIHNSKCLVMGFGRIGKILAKMLEGMGAKVYCEARKKTDIAFIKAYGYNAIELKELKQFLKEFDFIFNTIPYVILDKSYLNEIDKECIIIDLASKPGGVDFVEAQNKGLKAKWALALPRKSCTKNCSKLYI